MATADRNEGNPLEGNPDGFNYTPDLSNLSMSQQFSYMQFANLARNASREQLYRIAVDAYVLSVNTRNISAKMLKDKVNQEFSDAGIIE